MKFLDNVAVKLGVTKAEMTAVTVLTFFLLLGGALKYSGSVQDADKAIQKAEAARYSEAEVDSLLSLAMKPDNPAAAADSTGTVAVSEEQEESTQRSSVRHTSSKKNFSGTIVFRTASAAQLQMISGVGPVMARRLIEFRKESGGKVEHFNDFLKVKGIGKKKLELLQQHLNLD